MTDEARRHLQSARSLLAIVEARAEIELPEIIAHTAYYAMHHAALALLTYCGVSIPKTHSGLVSRLSQLDRDRAWQAQASVALFARALNRRLIADYQFVGTLNVQHARSARDDAVAFVSFL